MVEDRGGVLSGWDVARGRSSEAQGERIEVGKSECQIVVRPTGVDQEESTVVNTVKLENNGLGRLYYGWEISRRGSRLKVVSLGRLVVALKVRGSDTFCNIS